MRSEAKANANAEARARMYMRRDLGWLEGFPGEGNTWIVAPLGDVVDEVALDRALLHRSTRTMHMLVREFPKALPRLVGDVEVWAERRKALMDLVKRSVHGGESLPLSPTSAHPFAASSLKKKVASARQALSEMASVVTAFEWSGWTAPEGVCASLAWLRENETPLAQLSRRVEGNADLVGFRLWQLSQEHGERRVAPVLKFLAQPELWMVPMECDAHYMRAHSVWITKRKKEPRHALPPRKTAKLATRVIEWVLWLATQDARTQRKGLTLFPLLVESCDPRGWASWWKRVERVIQGASRLPEARSKKHDASGQSRLAFAARLELLSSEAPPALPAKVFSELLRELPSQEQNGLWQSLQSRLGHWPAIYEGAALRVVLSDQWLSVWRYSTHPQRAALRRLVGEFHAYARDVFFEADALLPWAGICRRMQGRQHDYQDIDYAIVENIPSAEKLATYFQTLREARAKTGAQAQLLVRLCATFPAGTVADAYLALRDSPVVETYISDRAWKVAASVAGKRTAHLPRLLMALTEKEQGCDDLGPSLSALDVLFEEEGFSNLVLEEIEAGRLNALVSAALQHKLVLREGGSIPRIPRHPPNRHGANTPWARRYPEELQPALARLAEFDEDASKTAQRILSKDFPDPGSLRRELAALEVAEGADGSAQCEKRSRRVRSLRARLESPVPPSARRLARLASKLNGAAERGALHGWVAALGEAYQGSVRSYLNVMTAPPWTNEAHVVRSLLSVTTLDSEFQTLAKRLLRARAGDGSWDLRDDPRNQAFLEKMERRGVRSEVWLADRSRTATTQDGRTLSLSLERDPLEVFQMGGHFNTCLSPGGLNYFSVIANAADINKRVIFARDSEGRVFGRQLLALTDDGGLLAFHCYAHVQSVGFRELAKEFTTTLADDMQTLVVATGRVSTLVASRWYDDGPVDFTNEHAALEEGSHYRRSLKAIEPPLFLEATAAALCPLPLNALTLPRLLALPELSERPELLVLLVPMAKTAALSLSAVVAIVEVLIQADGVSPDFAAKWVHEAALRDSIVDEHWHHGAAELLVRLDPVRALDLLRRTRPKEIRRWADDWDGWRLRLVARANERLYRKNKAVKFYRLAIEANSSPMFERECRAEIERIRAGGGERQ